MMWYAAQMAITRGVRPKSVYVSLERNMNCAIGLCGHCQFGPQFLCKDGPIFSYNRVASIMKVEDL
jgi:NAD(P)H-flavin reductase